MSEQLPKISVVFITYNRMVTLRPTFESFLRNTDYPRDRLELIITDDGSPEAVQSEIRQMPFDVFCLPKKRSGLGANTNRGLEAASGDLILHLQDDWECCGPGDYLKKAVRILQQRLDIAMLTFHRHPSLPTEYQTLRLEGEALRLFSGPANPEDTRAGRYAYSDRPHLKTREFLRQMGPYREGINVAMTEVDFCHRFAAQGTLTIADFSAKEFFVNIGEDLSYNWPWRKRLESWIVTVPGGRLLMHAYRRYLRSSR